LLQGCIFIPEAVSLRRFQHIHTALQSCCVGHIPRNNGCLILCPLHHSTNRKRIEWITSNTTNVIKRLFCHGRRNHLPRRSDL